jgi:hypothetical protein
MLFEIVTILYNLNDNVEFLFLFFQSLGGD